MTPKELILQESNCIGDMVQLNMYTFYILYLILVNPKEVNKLSQQLPGFFKLKSSTTQLSLQTMYLYIYLNILFMV